MRSERRNSYDGAMLILMTAMAVAIVICGRSETIAISVIRIDLPGPLSYLASWFAIGMLVAAILLTAPGATDLNAINVNVDERCAQDCGALLDAGQEGAIATESAVRSSWPDTTSWTKRSGLAAPPTGPSRSAGRSGTYWIGNVGRSWSRRTCGSSNPIGS